MRSPPPGGVSRNKQDLAEIKEDVKGLAARPGKRWDSIVSTLLAALVGAFAAWLLSGGM